MAKFKRKKPKTYRSKRGSWKAHKAGKVYKHRNKQALERTRKSGVYDGLTMEHKREREPSH